MNIYKDTDETNTEKITDSRIDELNNAETKIENYWENFLFLFQSGNYAGALEKFSAIASFFYGKPASYVDIAQSLKIPDFICQAVRSIENVEMLKEILRFSMHLLANGTFSTFIFFLQNGFFSQIDNFLNSENASLINSALAIISGVLSDFVYMKQPIPFNITPQRLQEILPNLVSYGSIFLLIGNIFFEMPETTNMEEYILFAFNIFNPYISSNSTNRFFNGVIFLFQKNPSRFWPVIQQYLPLINSLILLDENSFSLTKREENRNIALKTLCGLIDGPKPVKKAVEKDLPFQNLIIASSISRGEMKYMSMKLLSKSIKSHANDLSIVLDSDAYNSIPPCIESGEFSEKIGCLHLLVSLIIQGSDDIRVRCFFDTNFLLIISDFIDIDNLEMTKYALKITNLILSYQNNLIESYRNQDTIERIEEVKLNSTDPKIIKYCHSILNLVMNPIGNDNL